LDWKKIYAPLEVFAAAEERAQSQCTPKRLSDLKKRAEETLAVIVAEFVAEAERLRMERYLVLGVVTALSAAGVLLGCLVTTNGYDLLKSMLTVSGSGGVMTWGVAVAFKRLDHEAELRLLPKVFAAKFRLCHDCASYERVFEEFSRATESLRVNGPNPVKKLPT
jgi:hypothetical protein